MSTRTPARIPGFDLAQIFEDQATLRRLKSEIAATKEVIRASRSAIEESWQIKSIMDRLQDRKNSN